MYKWLHVTEIKESGYLWQQKGKYCKLAVKHEGALMDNTNFLNLGSRHIDLY